MLRIDNETATDANKFTNGNPITPVPATILEDKWLNTIQEELSFLVEEAGGTLDQTGADTEQVYDAILSIVLNNAVPGSPTGAIVPFGMSSEPSGWLECDGSAIDRTVYEDLFTALGTTYGAGDGSTTFNLPDLRGVFPRGWDNGRGYDSGRSLGSYQADDFKSHTHSHNAGTKSAGSFQTGSANYGGAGSYTNSATISSAGGAETRPKNVALMYCVKI